MKTTALRLFLILPLLVCGLASCEELFDEDFYDEENEAKTSYYGKMESHGAGENCMDCHKSGGRGEGSFEVAGTVYKADEQTAYPNTTIKLFSGPMGSDALVATIEVDGYGNFYTTDSVDWGNGLYPAVSSSMETQYMINATVRGACNVIGCHDENIPIFVN